MDGQRLSLDDLPCVQAGDALTFDTDSGGSQKVVVESADWIGEGDFGIIYHVRCRVAEILEGGETGPLSDIRDCVIKCFIRKGDALRAQKNPGLLKRYALPVFPTYQRGVSPNDEVIMMPDGNQGGTLTVSQNISLARQNLERQPLTEIENFPALLSEIASRIRVAAYFGIAIPFDTYFFFVRRAGSGASVRFSLDDTDNVRHSASDGASLVGENVRGAIGALDAFLAYAVSPAKKSEYMVSATAFLEARGREILEEISRSIDC